MGSNEKALNEARLDADLYGRGWLRVDRLGNIERIDPRAIFIDTKSPAAPASPCEHPDGLANGYCHICVKQIEPYSQSDAGAKHD